MERNSEQIIHTLMKDLINLLASNDEDNWASFFKQQQHKFFDLDSRTSAIEKILNCYKGGMGSFSDLVLHKNCEMLIEENDQLAELKNRLYNECLKLQKNDKQRQW